jgi:hypothetical protein
MLLLCLCDTVLCDLGRCLRVVVVCLRFSDCLIRNERLFPRRHLHVYALAAPSPRFVFVRSNTVLSVIPVSAT